MFQGRKFKCLTLIELIVAVSISVLLLSVSVPLFLKEKEGDRTKNEAQLVAAFIDKARNLGVHPENENAVAYRVKVSGTPANIINIFRLENLNGETTETLLDDKLYLNEFTIENMSPIDFYTFSGEYRGERTIFKVKNDIAGGSFIEIEVRSPGTINVL